MAKLLIVEDERDLRLAMVHNLEFDGHTVTEADNGRTGLTLALAGNFDLIILDIMMPGMDGLAVLKQIRGFNKAVPIMMLTAKSTEMDKVIGFELGADDYLTKPFGLGEFLARIKALLRRNRKSASMVSAVCFLDVKVDFDNYEITKDGKAVHFSQKEFLLLKYMIRHAGRALDKGQILGAVWGYKSSATSRTIDTHIARIRRKLGDRNPNRIIQTVPTVGYKFIAELGASDPEPAKRRTP